LSSLSHAQVTPVDQFGLVEYYTTVQEIAFGKMTLKVTQSHPK